MLLLLSSHQTKQPIVMEQKKFYQRFLLIFILIPFCLFTGCESHPANDIAEDLADQIEDIEDKTEEEEENDQEQQEEETVYTGYMTATANGKEFQSSESLEQFITTPSSITKNDGIYMVYISGFDISLGFENTKAVIIWAVGEDFSSLKIGKTWDSPLVDFLHEGVIANYYEADVTDDDEDDEDDNPNLEEVDNIYLKITAIDFENQKFSGEFSFAGKTEEGTSIDVTDGKFVDYHFDYNEQ